jgi:hypothetical protein
MMSVAKNKTRVLLSEQETNTFVLVQPLDDLEDFLDDHWGETHRGLVDNIGFGRLISGSIVSRP